MKYFIPLCIVISMISCKETVTQPRVEVITVQEMEEVLRTESVQLIDVRTRNEFASNHLIILRMQEI